MRAYHHLTEGERNQVYAQGEPAFNISMIVYNGDA